MNRLERMLKDFDENQLREINKFFIIFIKSAVLSPDILFFTSFGSSFENSCNNLSLSVELM